MRVMVKASVGVGETGVDMQIHCQVVHSSQCIGEGVLVWILRIHCQVTHGGMIGVLSAEFPC